MHTARIVGMNENPLTIYNLNGKEREKVTTKTCILPVDFENESQIHSTHQFENRYLVKDRILIPVQQGINIP